PIGRSNQEVAETAAHLVDRVFPHVPVRQWVLSLPFAIAVASPRRNVARKSPIDWRVINLGCRRSMPLPFADVSPRGPRPAAGLRLAVTVSIPKASIALPVYGAPPSRVSVCTQMSPFPPETGSGWNGCADMPRALLCP